MAFTLNPVQALELLRKYLEHRDETLQQFLAGVAGEADAIANVWDQACKALIKGTLTAQDMEGFNKHLWSVCMDHDNLPMFLRLEQFYRAISRGLPGLSGDRQELVLLHVGTLLVQRSLTKEKFEEAARTRRGQLLFIHPQSRPEDLEDLRSSVRVLQQEAAALNAIVKAYALEGG
jgi:hypothetical protein